MAERNYFVPMLILLILFFIICIVIFIRDRKVSQFLLLIPVIIGVILYSPLVKGNSKLENIMFGLMIITGVIVFSLNSKEKKSKYK